METKISFGFKKLPKKPTIIGAKPPEEKKVELIECLDEQSIKIIGHVEEEEKPLVIPMQGASKTLLDRIKEANDLKERSRIKYNKKPVQNGVEGDTRPDSELSIEELAARKLIEEARNYDRKKTATKVMTIALEDQLILEGAKEPTMDDYEAVPISDYGYAMLRGMGWSEAQTANKKNVEAPSLRPKGMGLGASIPGNQTNKIPVDKHGKELKLVKNAKAKIIAGKEKGNYCFVKGLDDDTGRVVVKTTIAGTVLSLNEFMLFPVSEEEYAKSSKILNNAKFEKYNKIHKEQKIKVEKKEKNDDIEYIPNKSDVKIEISSESEVEQEKYKRESDRHRNERSTKKENVQIKEERKSRTRSLSSSEKSSRKHTSRKARSRSKSSSRTQTKRQSSSSDDYKSARNKSRHSRSRNKRSRSRNKSRDRSRSKNKKDTRTSKEFKTSNSNLRRDKYDLSNASESEHERRHKKTKSKKSKKHKKEKRQKSKMKTRRYSSNSDSESS